MLALVFSGLWLAACYLLAEDFDARVNHKGIYKEDE